MNFNFEILKKKFETGFKWNITGSIFYEFLKISHQLILFKNLGISRYGQLGIIFSIIYLTIHIFSFAAGITLPAFVQDFTHSKKNFIRHALPYFLLQIPLLITGSFLCIYLLSKKFTISTSLNFAIPFFLILLEGVRMLLRTFLHNVFINKFTIICETILMLFYFSSIWIPFYFFGHKLSLNFILTPYLITSCIAVILFVTMLIKFYCSLPNKKYKSSPNLLKRIAKNRFFNYSTQLSEYFFCGNFLVPFFALKFGNAYAAVLKLASYLADAIKGIIHVSVGFSGGALFAAIKNTDFKTKLAAFYELSGKLYKILFFTLVLLTLNYQTLARFTAKDTQPQFILGLIAIFLLFLFSKHIFLAYEQFYIVEERTAKLFLFKALEIVMFLCAIHLSSHFSLFITLLNLIIVRIISFVIIATHAYATWKIKPGFRINFKFIITSFFSAYALRTVANFLR